MRLTQDCPLCSKKLVLLHTIRVETETFNHYKCGHCFANTIDSVDTTHLILTSVDGTKKARDYQRVGVEFILQSGFNCIIGDQMRLGKTPQSLLALKNAYAERTPVLILVKSANLLQWVREYKVWTDSLPLGIFMIQGTKAWIPPGFSAYIISMDTFSRNGMMERLMAFGFKLCIVDEMHSFKNVDSKRSQALIAFLKEINRADLIHEVPFHCMLCKEEWIETVKVTVDTSDAIQRVTKRSICPKCNASVVQQAAAHVKVTRNCGVIMLTGTAIKNRADEYFVPLNICDPAQFSSIERFRRNWLMQDTQGKWSKINPYALDKFQEVTKPYVLRREKEDVYTDLPALNRMYTIIEVEDKALADAYNKVLAKIEREMEARSSYSYFDSLGDLMILRQICGMAKVKWTADYVEASLLDNDKKIAIGIHHHSVRDALAYNLSQFGAVRLSGEDSAEKKDAIMRSFETSPERCLIINMLAGGVGMDFHYIDDIIILERQWSFADEQQFCFRFYNPDKAIKDRPTNVETILCKGTIDEWYHNLVLSKEIIFGETLSNHWEGIQGDHKSFRALLEETVSHRL